MQPSSLLSTGKTAAVVSYTTKQGHSILFRRFGVLILSLLLSAPAIIHGNYTHMPAPAEHYE